MIRKFLAVLSVTLLGASALLAEVKPAAVFADHMVLQRDRVVPVWGEATPGETVTVKFRQQVKSVTADDKGRWQVKLDPLTAGGPDKLIISGTKSLEINDVLVGEVWIGSGQSNMAMPVKWAVTQKDAGLTAIVAAAPYAQVRQYRSNTRWQLADAKNLPDWCALPFCFALRLNQELGVPVGIMIGAVGGSGSGMWLTEEALKADPGYQEDVKRFAATFDLAAEQKAYDAANETWKKSPNNQNPPCPPKVPGEAFCAKIGAHFAEHIRPMIPYAMRGVLWDQGESGTALVGVQNQFAVMRALISSWRREWGDGQFPFIYVQKPSGGGCAWDYHNSVTKDGDPFAPLPAAPNGDPRAGGVDTYVKMLAYPKTGMVISSDLGAGVGNHPGNKSGYGHRAAGVALGMVYGKKLEYYGPLYASHKIDGEKLRVTFTHVGEGLAFQHGDKLQGFALAGADLRFHWADAVIDGDSVVLTSPKVPKPVAASYAWAGERPWANLFNKDGLPAIPFRTDKQ